MSKINPSFKLTILPPMTALERTEEAIKTKWAGDNARINQAKQFIKKAQKSDKKRKIEKQSRKKNRKK